MKTMKKTKLIFASTLIVFVISISSSLAMNVMQDNPCPPIPGCNSHYNYGCCIYYDDEQHDCSRYTNC